jgi:L-ascorbate metabolism protein UlaG (beta-lactamase superfamily)
MPADVLNNGVKLTWYGHSAVLLETPGGKRVFVDPFVHSNPSCPPALHDVRDLDLLLITHGHQDHMADALAVIASGRPRAVVAVHEIAVWLSDHNVAHVTGMNHGGTLETQGLRVTMTPALHSSSVTEGDTLLPGGAPAGYVLELENGFRLYHAGDTALFGDMALIRELWRPELALLPIGDHYTMGPEAAAQAARLLGVRRVVPIHYGTFPLLTGTPDRLRAAGEGDGLEVLELEPGETLT